MFLTYSTSYEGYEEIVDSDVHTSYSHKLRAIFSLAKKKVCSIWTKKTLYKRFPILQWLPLYNSDCTVGDLLAGFTVGLTVIPQALAYASIAGLPPQYGLYGSFLGCFVYILLGSCKDVPVGPTAVAALMTFQAVNGRGVEHAVLLCFLSGVIQLLMGFFGLGFLIDFVSGPVSSGFTSAAALIIVTSQVKDLLGISASGNTFVDTWKSIFKDIHNIRMWDTVLGVGCIIILLLLRIVAQINFGDKSETSKTNKIINKSLWVFGTSRNAILVIVSGIVGYFFCTSGEPPFKVIGEVPQGLPDFQLPPFGYSKENNGTITEVGIMEMISNLGSGIIVVPLVGFLENIAICKAFSNGKPIDATQELLAIGASNVLNSFVQSFPGTGSLSRSAVNNASGVRTPLGGLYTGLLVILALLFLTPYFFFIPKSTLAAIIIAAVIFMVEVKVVKPLWRSKKSDFFLAIVTFVSCLILPLEQGILVGIGINLVYILYHAARPKISVEKLTSVGGAEYLLLTPDRCLIFPSTDYVRNLVTKHSIRQGIPVIIDCSHIYGADYTAALVIETLTKDFATRDQPLLFYNLKPSVSSVFEGLSPKDFVVFYDYSEVDELLKNRKCIKKQMEIMEV
ncbi:sodium-independent sulfate anion transporter-like isoform X2 [Sitophilus oryzae]|uniref:Sodium-independent sulfate anion transporter-like isoform X2 n=1 Tax=Sitophilus oryzae TaxID=7048 RepID=A0A6J2Y6H9_SITOR|nr:sodium-independent sulfate anion transporter-like isoform X2 [Sitophilus oryzae]XP_030758675.1 sodium-independent sulfate anion transporter-like isoform X2 [Sitophilus oryzae]